MSKSFSKDEVFNGLAEVGLALGNKHRLQILSLLSHGPKTVEQLVEALAQSKATTSAHLKTLRLAGLVSPRKEGKYVWYSIANQGAEGLWITLRNYGEKLLPGLEGQVRAWDQDDNLLSDLSEVDLNKELDRKKFFLIDLRPEKEFALAHLPTAVNIPWIELDDALSKLKANRPILAYCRGPYCLNARVGIGKIAEVFPNARRLRFSVPEWRQAGFPIESNTNEQTLPKQ